MSNRRNESVSDVDYEATIRHYQDLNDQIELKTHEVFESVIKLSNQTDKSVKSDDIASEVIDTRSSLNDHSSQPNHANKNQLIVDMNKKLLAMQNELQGISLKNKQLVGSHVHDCFISLADNRWKWILTTGTRKRKAEAGTTSF